jgi:serine/threonine-protein kinase RsbW
VTEELSTVRLELDSRAESPALVRAALTGVAQSQKLDAELFDDLKTAVTEACNNVVLYAYNGEPGPYVVTLTLRPSEIEATIRDWGGGIQHIGASEDHMGVGLAVISALADRAEFISPPEGGTEVRMIFAGRGDGIGPLEARPESAPAAAPPLPLEGDVVATVWPVDLLGDVLGRVARAVAARTALSLDRFDDIRLVSDALAAFAASAADAAEVSFAAAARGRGLELTLGPFPPGEGARLLEDGLTSGSGSSVTQRASELSVERVDGVEAVRVVIEES